jgi:hypothetical protein
MDDFSVGAMISIRVEKRDKASTAGAGTAPAGYLAEYQADKVAMASNPAPAQTPLQLPGPRKACTSIPA